jgi:uncharacterized protein (TIGR00725 family)
MTHHVAVIGPGDDATLVEEEIAREVGRRLAAEGCLVITGGLGGVMAAASLGAADAGGTSVGLLPGASRDDAAAALTVTVPTGLGELRNALVIRSADAVVAVGGSWGTASEVALAMRTGVPVVMIGGWRFQDAAGRELEVPRAATAAEAVTFVLAVLAKPANP